MELCLNDHKKYGSFDDKESQRIHIFPFIHNFLQEIDKVQSLQSICFLLRRDCERLFCCWDEAKQKCFRQPICKYFTKGSFSYTLFQRYRRNVILFSF